MLDIYIARHGQDKDNERGVLNGRRDMMLTPLGIRQARELARGIKERGLKFDRVYTSPLERAKLTAQIVTQWNELPPPRPLEGLIERDFGIMTGKPVADIQKLCGKRIVKTATVTYFLDPEGAETFPQLLERATGTLKLLATAHPFDARLLLVTHGDIGKMLYAAHYKLPWKRFLPQFHFGNSELLHLSSNRRAGGEPRVIQIEQHNH